MYFYFVHLLLDQTYSHVSVNDKKTTLMKCSGNLQRQEGLFHDKLNGQQSEIEAPKRSSAIQTSYADATRQASSAPPNAPRQLRSAPPGTPPSGTSGGTGSQQNARQTTMTRRTNTATSVGTSMLPSRRQQAGTIASSGTNNDVLSKLVSPPLVLAQLSRGGIQLVMKAS